MASDMSLDLFMMCRTLSESACTQLPDGYHLRGCRRDELELWKAMPFDDVETAQRHADYMTAYFRDVYADQADLFFRSCVFVCDAADQPIGTCFAWRAYGAVTTLHWFKIIKPYEGRGLGRALLSHVLRSIPAQDFPVFLHTQLGSFRAIKLYADFGFSFLTEATIGHRQNHWVQCRPLLAQLVPAEVFAGLRTTMAPDFFLTAAASSPIHQF